MINTDPPPSCETCDVVGCNERTNTTVDFISDIRKQNVIEEFISKHGCLFHPLSRAWLNRDVIRELERRVGRLGAYPDNTQAIRVYTETIALLKGEAKKMNDSAMIDYIASEWLALGGDSEGFAFVQARILKRLREREDQIKGDVKQ